MSVANIGLKKKNCITWFYIYAKNNTIAMRTKAF